MDLVDPGDGLEIASIDLTVAGVGTVDSVVDLVAGTTAGPVVLAVDSVVVSAVLITVLQLGVTTSSTTIM